MSESDGSFFEVLKRLYSDADSWGERVFVVVAAPILWLFVAALAPPSYECPGCGEELHGHGHNCPKCGYAFTERGELRRINDKLDRLQERDSQ